MEWRTLLVGVVLGVGSVSVVAQNNKETRGQGALPAEEAVRRMVVPEGFRVRLFAAEPVVQQPVGFAIDQKGRLWVGENFSYPKMAPSGKDRIVVLEDGDGDGKCDRRTVFYEGLNYLTGVEVGMGGVWVVSPPYLKFIPDGDGDGVADGEAVVLLDGFGHQGVHNIANGLTWGPDGWLYGGHGGTSRSRVGKPGTPDSERIPFDGGVWRYHPVRHVFERFAEGTVNPWGMEYDDFGQLFMPNSVMPHLYHVIQGAHYERRQQTALSQYAYGFIDTVADHLHYVGGNWQKSGYGAAGQSEAGGGHAHCGLTVYLGGAFPEAYRNTIFMNNVHGNRMNHDLPERRGSGYVARHGRDFLLSNDIWHHGITLRYGAEGEVYLSDWYETGECHFRTPDVSNGRIYRIDYEGAETRRREEREGRREGGRADVGKLSSAELVGLQLEKNEWWVREARKELQRRGGNEEVWRGLKEILRGNPDVTRKLRAMWALWVTGGLSEGELVELMRHEDEYVRGWAVQFLAEHGEVSDEVVRGWEGMAEKDPSPVVRLYLAAALQRVPFAQRWGVLERLVGHGEDAGDQNLPMMYWWAAEPMVVGERGRAMELAARTKVGKVRELIVRRLAAATGK